MEKAYFAGGCFWCLEATFKLVPGVKSVVSGYAGGNSKYPTYQQVSKGNTGHAETVEIFFDPKKISYRELLELFFIIHDPSQKDRQGSDIGTQYRSAIFFTKRYQEEEANNFITSLVDSGKFNKVYTEISKLNRFWKAEEYHQDYFTKHPNQAYCQFMVRPKVDKIKNLFGE